MRWMLVVIVLAVTAGLLAAYVPAHTPVSESPATTPHPHTAEAASRASCTETRSAAGERMGYEYVFRLGYWQLRITVGEVNGTLTATYVGEKPLEVEDPLLPITAGLQLTLRYSDGGEEVVRKSGTKYWNTTLEIEPGEKDSIGFESRGLEFIGVGGTLPDGTPVEIKLPLNQPPATVTMTEIVYSCPETQTAEAPGCVVEHVASYPEPPAGEIRRAEERNATIYTDGVVEIRAPAEVRGNEIPVVMVNLWNTPIVSENYYVEYTIVNASIDGSHYFDVGWTGGFAVTMTMPPVPPSCLDQLPGRYGVFYKGSLLEPGEQAKVLYLWLPRDLESLQGAGEAWLYVKTKVTYSPVAEAYSIAVPDNPDYSYLENFLAIKLYEERSIEIVFRVHVYLASG